MGNAQLLASDRAAILGVIDPDANTAAAYTTAWIDAGAYHSFMALVMAGALGTSATLDAKLEQATDSSGTGAKDIASKAITQLTQAGTDSDKQAIINLRAEEMDIANDFTHFRLSMTVAAATSDSAALVLGMNKRYGAASSGDAASVDEIVA